MYKNKNKCSFIFLVVVGIKFCSMKKNTLICVSYYLRRSRNQREVDFEKLINKMKKAASPPLRIGKDDMLARARVSIQKHQQCVFSIFFLSYYFYSLKIKFRVEIYIIIILFKILASSRSMEERNRIGWIH